MITADKFFEIINVIITIITREESVTRGVIRNVTREGGGTRIMQQSFRRRNKNEVFTVTRGGR